MAEAISLNGVNTFIFSAFKAASSASVGGISGVLKTDQTTVAMEQILPKKNEA